MLGVITARFASTLFSGKALIDIDCKSTIKWVYKQAMKANLD
jgi:CMP-2-keto-3-deoxyoctulosonic acid synthetase